jgi:retron-type reverse transcriptase
MTNPEFRKKAISSILTKQKIVAQRSARIFSDNIKNSNLKRTELLSGTTILEEAVEAMASLTWKIVAIEILSNNKGSTTAGVDLKAFKAVPYETETTKQALLSLQREIKKMKADLSIYKGNTDQTIKRKGIEKLNCKEKRRRWLKSGNNDAIDLIKTIKQKYALYTNPLYSLREAREQKNDIINHNRSLKLELLNNMKFFKLKHFTADAIRTVNIPKSNGKTRPLGIPTMKDRALQMLLKLTMEPYMEPLGDPHSFGFRPGRGCHQAVSTVANRTTWNRRKGMSRLRMKTFRAGTQSKISSATPKFFQTQHLLDAVIKGCFDNISHQWLIENVPMPKGFEHLLPLLIEAPRLQEDNTLQPTTKGIPQGGIISPMLMNWTLDGLESLITTTIAKAKVSSHPWVEFFGSSEKKAFMEKNDMLTGLKGRRLIEKIRTRAKIWFVRYADDFILGTNSYEYIPIIKEAINAFLEERGLQLSSEKTKEITWKIGAKFDFLSWTFHLIRPKKVNWIVAAPKRRAGRLTD